MDEQTGSVLVPDKAASEVPANSARLKSIANLIPHQFKPGQSGNPSGRPKKLITDATRELLAKKDAATGLTNAHLVAEAQIREAIKGETAAYNAIADRTEGKVPQPISGDEDGEPLRIQFVGFADH